VGARLRAEPLPTKGTDSELDQELEQYRRNVERVRELLPSIHGQLLAERARLGAQRARVRSAAEWARALAADVIAAVVSSFIYFRYSNRLVLAVCPIASSVALQGSLRSGQIADHVGQIRSSFGILLLRQLCGFGAQVSLLRGELVQCVAVKHALRRDIVVGGPDLGHRRIDARAALQAGDQVLNTLEHIGAWSGKQLRAGQVGLQAELTAQGYAVYPSISLIRDPGWRTGIQHIGSGLVRCSPKT